MRDLGLSFVRVASGQAEGGVGVAIRLGLMRNVEVVVEDCLWVVYELLQQQLSTGKNSIICAVGGNFFPAYLDSAYFFIKKRGTKDGRLNYF